MFFIAIAVTGSFVTERMRSSAQRPEHTAPSSTYRLGTCERNSFTYAVTPSMKSYIVAEVTKVTLRHSHLGRGDIGAGAHGVVVVVDLAVGVVNQNVSARVAVRITPNGKPLVRERPVESVVLSRRLAREILFVRTREAPEVTYNKIGVVEGLKLEKILGLHVADVFVNGTSRSSFGCHHPSCCW